MFKCKCLRSLQIPRLVNLKIARLSTRSQVYVQQTGHSVYITNTEMKKIERKNKSLFSDFSLYKLHC